MPQKVTFVPSGPVPPAEEILKQCILEPGLPEDKTYAHLANMPVFYNKSKTAFKSKSTGRRAIHGNPIEVVVNFAGVPNSENREFLGVTRDHLKDGKSAKTHANAAGMFSVVVDGIVTIIQPKDHMKTDGFKVGDYISGPIYNDIRENDLFEIKDKNMKGVLLRNHAFNVKPTSGYKIIGRIVEMRTDTVDEIRVKLLPFGARVPTEKDIARHTIKNLKKEGEGIVLQIQKVVREAEQLDKLIRDESPLITPANLENNLEDAQGYLKRAESLLSELRKETDKDEAENKRNGLDTLKLQSQISLEKIRKTYENVESGNTLSKMAPSATAPPSTAASMTTSADMQSTLESAINPDFDVSETTKKRKSVPKQKRASKKAKETGDGAAHPMP